MSPTKSGAKSRKRSFPIAQRLAPFMQNLSKSTFFRLNSFTVHVSHSATWFSVHCLGSEEDHKCWLWYMQFVELCVFRLRWCKCYTYTMNCSTFCIMLHFHCEKTLIFGYAANFHTAPVVNIATYNMSIKYRVDGSSGCKQQWQWQAKTRECRYSMITQTRYQEYCCFQTAWRGSVVGFHLRS